METESVPELSFDESENDNCYKKISEMNVREMQRIIANVFKIDRVLHQQQLTYPWVKATMDFSIDNVIVKKNLLSEACKKKKLEMIENKNIINARVLKKIFHKVSDRAAFLVEDKLLQILEPFVEEENCLVRLDNIFTALRINDIHNIAHLTQFFGPYCWCPYCCTNLAYEAFGNILKTGNDLEDLSLQPKIHGGSKKLQQNDLQSNEFCANHFLVIEPTLVLTALKRYTKQYSIEAQIIKRNLV